MNVDFTCTSRLSSTDHVPNTMCLIPSIGLYMDFVLRMTCPVKANRLCFKFNSTCFMQ